MHSRHVGFRVKLLLFYIITVAAVVSLDISVQLLSYNAVREFETRLSRYHDIHRLRQTLSAHYNRMERMLRESDIPDAVQLDEDQQFFYYNLIKLKKVSLNPFLLFLIFRPAVVELMLIFSG